MKAVSASLFAAAAAQTSTPCGEVLSAQAKINDPTFADCHNSENGASWVAGISEFFDGMTFEDAGALMGVKESASNGQQLQALPSLNVSRPHPHPHHGPVPSDFDARTKWPGLIHPIRNQAQCGSCWAFSASEVWSDRVAIILEKPSPVLSPEDLVSCAGAKYPTAQGCKGGTMPDAWNYIMHTGLLTDSCFPYTAGDQPPSDGGEPTCATKCADGSPFTRIRAKTAGNVLGGVVPMQKELMTHGPLGGSFFVYKSFFTYKSGVYSKLPEEGQKPEDVVGEHGVKIIGWGIDSGVDYWLIANSWDTTWGEQGFFRTRRGNDECGIESPTGYGGAPWAGHGIRHGEVSVVV